MLIKEELRIKRACERMNPYNFEIGIRLEFLREKLLSKKIFAIFAM